MKKYLLFIVFFPILGTFAQQTNDSIPKKQNPPIQIGEYKYQVSARSMNEEDISSTNKKLDILKGDSRRGWADLGAAIATAYKSSFTQKTVNATSNLVSLGVTYISELIKSQSNQFNEWSKFKQDQCLVKKLLSSDEQISDFYYLPSPNGALDPLNLKFKGFTCRKFIEVSTPPIDSKKTDSIKSSNPKQSRKGGDVFYLSCSLRTDSLGVAHMANHSKFMLEVDTLVFYPKNSNVPNGPQGRSKEQFTFDKYSNLQLNVNVKVLSSWVNEAIMITSDHQLGEFNINVVVNRKDLCLINTDSAFVYIKDVTKNDSSISITGDSFIVPRSFVGTHKEPMWGTGQYKLVIEVAENCQLNPQHYIKTEYVGNGKAVAFANLPDYRKWKKDVWKEEWRMINKTNLDESIWKQAWKQIKVAYIGNNWVKELVDPLATQLYDFEAKELKNLFDIDGSFTPVKSGSSTSDLSPAAPGNAQNGVVPSGAPIEKK